MAASLETQQRPVMPVFFFFACQRNANIKSSTETHRLFFPKSSWIICNFLFSFPPPYSPTLESETSLGVTGAESAQGAASARRNGMETIPFGSSLSTAFDLPFAELGVRMCACLALLREKQWSGLARWVSERGRITPNRTPFVVFAPAACAPRRGAARRAARAPFMAAATRGVVGPRSCALVWVQATTVPRPISRALVAPIRGDTATASATATVELGFRRERTATNRQDEAQNATGESVPRAPFLTPSLCPSRSYVRSLARSQASLSGCHSVDLESHVSLGHSSRDLSLEDRFSATRSLKRRAIVAAKRSEDATARPRDFRGESRGCGFLWLTPGARSDARLEGKESFRETNCGLKHQR